MTRMKWWLVCWLVLFLTFHDIICKTRVNYRDGKKKGSSEEDTQGGGKNKGSSEEDTQGGGKNKGSSEEDTQGGGKNKGSSEEDTQNSNSKNRGGKSKDSQTQNEKSYKCPPQGKLICQSSSKNTKAAKCCMEDVYSILKTGNRSVRFSAIQRLEKRLEETEVNHTTSMSVNHFAAVLHRHKGPFRGLNIFANENEARTENTVNRSEVRVRLPRELAVGSDSTIVFCMITQPETKRTTSEDSDVLYQNRLVGLSVRGKSISGLKERVNIIMNLTVAINETQTPKCVFLDFSTQKYNHSGCETLWTHGQSHITCSCDHLTYFGVLMISPDLNDKDWKILSYITLIGCSLSLFTLVITVLLFITKKKVRADVTMKVHINLAIALILLNLHFLPSQAAAATSTQGLCLYMAIALHYSLLATFSWMALEGFHLYLLLVRVFNIYIRRYLLKLSMVGWGIPAIIVCLVVIIDRNAYGPVPLDTSNSTTICYIHDNTVKMVTTVGVFSLVFLFDVTMLGVTIRKVLSLRKSKEFGQKDRNSAKRDLCTLLGITTLLGIPWGLIFFSFGYLTTPGLYLFCILNSLQGFFIFLWFVMSLRKFGNSPTETSSVTRSTNS